MAEAGLRAFAHAREIDAVDGVDLGLAGLGGHAGDGVVAGLGGAALFERGLGLGGLCLGLLGVLAGLGFVLGDLAGGHVHGALVAQALLRQALIGHHVLGFLDLAEEVVDGKFGFAGRADFSAMGHREAGGRPQRWGTWRQISTFRDS